MTEEVEEKPVSFPTVLYFQDPVRGMLRQEFATMEPYAAAREAGWHSSLASFGVETHPSQPGMSMAIEASVPTAASAGVNLQELTTTLETLHLQRDQMAEALQVLTQRVTALEVLAQSLSEPPPPPPEVARTTAAASEDEPHRPRERRT
jgi:hypothetical protein